METKEIKINGKSLKVGFSMGVAIDWERQSGRPFNVGESLSDITGQMMLCYVALKRCNKNEKIPDFEEWADGLSFEDNARMQSAVASCLESFYSVPGTKDEQKSEEKNA